MCDSHGRHVTVIDGLPRCVICGHQIFKTKIRLRDIPRELWHRHQARKAWWREPVLYIDTFRY